MILFVNSMQFTVIDVVELTGPKWLVYKPDYEALVGYSCLTPEGEVCNIKQYKVSLTDGTEKYSLYGISYETVDDYRFSTNGVVFDNGFSTAKHLPYIGEVVTGYWRMRTLPKSANERRIDGMEGNEEQEKPLRIISHYWCCLPRRGDSVANNGPCDCYCYGDKPFVEMSTGLYEDEREYCTNTDCPNLESYCNKCHSSHCVSCHKCTS